MTNGYVTEELLHDQELYRAQAIIDIAERDEKDISTMMRDYGVATSIINELGVEVVEYVPKARKAAKQDKLVEWAKANIGQTTNGNHLAEEASVSYATANKFIQTRRDIFSRIKRGQYLVKDPAAERTAANN